MSSVSSVIASYAFNALWQTPLLALTGWLICRLLKRLGPGVEHRVWVAILLSSVLLPAGRALHFLSIPHVASRAHVFTSVRMLALHPVAMYPAALWTLPASIMEAVAAVYLAILCFSLFRFTTSVFSAVGMVKRSRPVHLVADLSNAWREAQRFVDLSGTRILSSPSITGPVTLWFEGPVLLLPERFADSTSVQDFRVALAHECAHMKRHDYLKNLFYEGVSLLIAFHPASWLIKAQIAQSREMTCDAMAVEAVGGSRVYVQSLLRLASAVASCPTAMSTHAIGIFDANILEKRIMTLMAKKKEISSLSRYGLVFVASAGLFLAVSGGAASAVGLSSESSVNAGTSLRDDRIYKIGKDVSAPKVITTTEPEYPQSARGQGPFNGTCLIGLVVDASGLPREVHVVRSLSKAFDENAVKAVEQYRFKPAEHRGKPVSVGLSVEVNFQLF
jgi:TonB family protein